MPSPFVLGSLSDAYRATALRKRAYTPNSTLTSAAALSIQQLAARIAASRAYSANPVARGTTDPLTLNDEHARRVNAELRAKLREKNETRKYNERVRREIRRANPPSPITPAQRAASYDYIDNEIDQQQRAELDPFARDLIDTYRDIYGRY